MGWARLLTLIGLPRARSFSLAATTVKADTTSDPFLKYSQNVDVVYNSPVLCTVFFDTSLSDLTNDSFTTSPFTRISGFRGNPGSTRYVFTVDATESTTVEIKLAPGAVRNMNGDANTNVVDVLRFEFYRYPPSATLIFENFHGALMSSRGTNQLFNPTVWIVFNSTTVVDGTHRISADQISFMPGANITSPLEAVAGTAYPSAYRLGMAVHTVASSGVDAACVDPNTRVPTGFTAFACSYCRSRGGSQVCLMEVTGPPASLTGIEFLFDMVISYAQETGIAWLGYTSDLKLPWLYDTLWAQVSMDAPTHVQGGSFFVNVSWSEPMLNVSAVLPTFSPPCSVEVESRDSSSMRLLVTPSQTAVVSIEINGSESTLDSLRNANDYFSNSAKKTGVRLTTVFSLGPPLPGTLDIQYIRPKLGSHEYSFCEAFSTRLSCPDQCVWDSSCREDIGGLSLANDSDDHNLTISWSGFETAERYDIWVSSGTLDKFFLPVTYNVSSPYVLENFRALLAVEYTVCVRAWNFWGDGTTDCTTFRLPDLSLRADGSAGWMRLPNIMGPLRTEAQVELLVRSNSFMNKNPLHVLTVRAVRLPNAGGSDSDPCSAAASDSTLRCIPWMNFHLEVPDSQFVIFRRAILLRVTFGAAGWGGAADWAPQLRYWSTYYSSWTPVAETCTPDQANETWDAAAGVYTVSICHLSQFALFERAATRAGSATTSAPSYDDPIFLAFLAGFIVLLIFACGACYWSCLHRSSRRRVLGQEKVAYGDMGIHAIMDRVPRWRAGQQPRRPPGRPPRGRPGKKVDLQRLRQERAVKDRARSAGGHDVDGEEASTDARQLLQLLPPRRDPDGASEDRRGAADADASAPADADAAELAGADVAGACAFTAPKSPGDAAPESEAAGADCATEVAYDEDSDEGEHCRAQGVHEQLRGGGGVAGAAGEAMVSSTEAFAGELRDFEGSLTGGSADLAATSPPRASERSGLAQPAEGTAAATSGVVASSGASAAFPADSPESERPTAAAGIWRLPTPPPG